MQKFLSLALVIIFFSNAIASTEEDLKIAQTLADNAIIVNQSQDPSTYRLDDSITRVELLGIALKIKNMSTSGDYTCRGYFADVSSESGWICAVVESAADEGLITRANSEFRPNDTVTRAEALAILMKAKNIDIISDCGGSCDHISIDSDISWQMDIFITGYSHGIVYPEKIVQELLPVKDPTYSTVVTFRPNDSAMRKEVFHFANNVSKYTPAVPAESGEETVPSGILNTAELANLKKDAYIQGRSDAKILAIEFADFECLFCKRLNNDGTIKDLQKKYGDIFAFSYQNYPLSFHPLALPAAHTLECVGAQGGSEKFFAFINKLYSYDTPSQANIDTVLSELSLNNETLKNCVKNATYSDKINTQMSQVGELGVVGTPATIIINTQTLRFEVVSGALPKESFIESIERLLK